MKVTHGLETMAKISFSKTLEMEPSSMLQNLMEYRMMNKMVAELRLQILIKMAS